MITILSCIIVILVGVIVWQAKATMSRSANLKYTHEKLNQIITSSSNEKVFIVTDDQELIALLNEINHLLDDNQIKQANYTKTELSMKKMVSNISHDLKTPLTVVLGYIETLKLDSQMSSEERQMLLNKVHNKTLEVLQLIHKFFDLARIEAGDKDIPIARININELCRRNILQFYDILITKGFEVHIEIPDNNIHASGNEEALDRIMNNLISNAIYHGGDGKAIGLKINEDDEFVYVEIWDRGKGIDYQHIDRVFERMYTLDDSRNKSNEGSGLGLTITKRLVQKLGGTIQLSSKPYERTVFTIRLQKVRY